MIVSENQGMWDGPGTDSMRPLTSPVSFKLSAFICLTA